MRKPMIAGNWKMNKTLTEAVELASLVKRGAYGAENVEIMVAPPFVVLADVSEVLAGSGVITSAQNCHWEKEGAYTGEVSADMIKSVGATHVIIGHSERRKYFAETDDTVRRKVHLALASGLVPVVCVGETLEEREAEKTLEVVSSQVKGALSGIEEENASGIVLAYEPVWAIGTGKTASPEQAQEVHAMIRKLLSELYSSQLAGSMRILYGGSMNPGNCEALLSEEDIDGGLIGGASLKAESFVDIIKKAHKVYS